MRGVVLIIDDDPLVVKGMARVLSRAHWEPIVATSVIDAFEKLASFHPDVAIVDYDLGEDNGLDVLEWMQDHLPSTPRILMSAHNDLPMVVEAVNRGGALKVLRKPFQPRELLQVIDSALSGVARLAEATTAHYNTIQKQERLALDEALQRDQLWLALQPIVRADNHEIEAYEALLRPLHPHFHGPTELISAAETYGRVDQLGALVFELAAEQIPKIPRSTKLFINLHPAQLDNPRALAESIRPLREFADQVVIEITERSLLSEITHWERSIHTLQQAGFSLAVDDLGSGYSTLSILADLQPNFIKLDMSLVRGVDSSPRKQRLIQLLVSFGATTQAGVIGEGIETDAELRALKDCGIPLLQGYLLGRPAALP